MVLSHMRTIQLNKSSCVACSKSIADEFSKNKLNITYIQNGVDTEKYFSLSQEGKLALRKRLNVDINKKYLLWLGA